MNRIIHALKSGAALALAALAGITLLKGRALAYSDSISSNNATALVIRITPNVDRGVQIDTGNVHLDLGSVNLGASSQTVRPATVTITGNITNTELDLAAQISGGWSFDNAQTRTSTGTNLLNAWVSFTSISSAAAPSQGDEYFRVGTSSGAKLTSATGSFASTAVGLNGSSGTGRFEADDPAANMDGLNPADQRHLWTYFTLPPMTSLNGAQDINITLSVRAGP